MPSRARDPRSSGRSAPRGLRRRARRARCCGATRGSSSTRVTARSDAGRRLDDALPAPPRRRWRSRSSTSTATRDGLDAAIVAYPHGRGGAGRRRRCASAACGSSTSRADFRLRDLRDLRALVRRAPRARAARRAVYGLPELYRDAIAGADLVANPGCFPTAALLALAPLARAGLLADVVIDAKTGVSGAGRARDRRRRTSSSVDENVGRYSVGRPPPHAGDRPGAGRARRAGRPVDVHRRTSCRSTRASWSPATSRRRASRRRPSCARSTRTRYARRAVRRARRRARRACATCARRTSAAIHVARRRAHRQGLRLRRDRQPLEGHLVAGGPEPQPDVRLRRERGDRVTRLLRLALGAEARARHASSTGGLPRGFRAAGVARGHQARAARSTSACSSATRPDDVSAARFTRSGVARRAGARHARALRPRPRCAPSPPTPATRTPRPARRASTRRARDAGRRVAAAGARPGRRRGRARPA